MVMPTPVEKPGLMDWFPRLMAWGTMVLPRVAPSRWHQESNRRQANDLLSQSFTVKADDGVKLDAWYFPVSSPAADANAAPRPTVFFTHGWTETKEFHVRLARVLLREGYPVVLYDLRGHGKSGGTCTLGVLEQGDLRAVIDESAKRGWAGSRVLTMGVSMGAAASLCHAATDPRVIGVVAYAPFASFLDAIHSYGRRYAPFLSTQWGARGFQQSFGRRGLDLEQSNPIRCMAELNVPTVLAVGDCDVNLPACDHARLIHQAAKPGLSRLIEVPQANHFNICMGKWPGLDEAVLEFLAFIQ